MNRQIGEFSKLGLHIKSFNHALEMTACCKHNYAKLNESEKILNEIRGCIIKLADMSKIVKSMISFNNDVIRMQNGLKDRFDFCSVFNSQKCDARNDDDYLDLYYRLISINEVCFKRYIWP